MGLQKLQAAFQKLETPPLFSHAVTRQKTTNRASYNLHGSPQGVPGGTRTHDIQNHNLTL